MVGTAGQRRGELKVFDLDHAKDISKSESKLSDLVFSGPLNKKLVSIATSTSFIAQTSDGLFKVEFD